MTSTREAPTPPRKRTPAAEYLARLERGANPLYYLTLAEVAPHRLVLTRRSDSDPAVVYRHWISLVDDRIHDDARARHGGKAPSWMAAYLHKARDLYRIHAAFYASYTDTMLREQLALWTPARLGSRTLQWAALANEATARGLVAHDDLAA